MPRNRLEEWVIDRPFTEEKPDEEMPASTQKIIDLLFDPGQWFRIPYPLVRVLNPPAALVLSFLINQSYRVRAHERRKASNSSGYEWRGWFYCTTKQMEKMLGIPARTQRRILLDLRCRKFIRHDLRGVPAKRYYKIVWKTISQILEE